MYLRFTTTALDEDSKKPCGVFIEAYLLLDSGDLNTKEWKQLRAILDWFSLNLPPPPKNFKASRAIFWFDSTAEESIRRIWELIDILKAHDRHIVIHKCRRLANVSYRDKYQVAAYPSPLDSRITQQ